MASPIDRNQVDRLVVEHLPAVLRFALRLTGDEHAAEEVVQETFCRVLKRWQDFRGDAAFGTWMLQIAVNVDRDRRRRRTFEPLATETVAGSASEPADEAAMAETKNVIRQAIEQLPDRQREVALLSLGEGLAVNKIAQVLQITEANVHSCLHLARKRIAQTIGFDYTMHKFDSSHN